MDVRAYAAEYRRFAAFLRAQDPFGPQLCRIACGANARDYSWTEGMMTICKRGGGGGGGGGLACARRGGGGGVRFAMEMLSLHLYCSVRLEGITGREGEASPSVTVEASPSAPSTTRSAEDVWFTLMQKADAFGETLRAHVAIMDRHDPERLVGLALDEWGVWYAEDAGSSLERRGQSAALLEQPCTLRDALVAALCLHRMVESCERVRLANLAQAVNVLHAPLVVTKRTADGGGGGGCGGGGGRGGGVGAGVSAQIDLADSPANQGSDGGCDEEDEKLVRTPTFHALKMLSVHHDGTRLHSQLTRTTPYTYGAASVPRISVAASTHSGGRAHHVSIVHTHPHAGTTLSIELRGLVGEGAANSLRLEGASVLTANRMGAYECSPVTLASEAARLNDRGVLRLELPSKSLVVVELRGK